MSQLLCEQVVGRGLRRRTYELGEDGLMTEEVAKVFGVPFEVVPFKANASPLQRRRRSAITFRRCRGGTSRDYVPARRGLPAGDTQSRHGGLASVAPLFLDPLRIPPEVEVKASLPTNRGDRR